MLDAESPCIKSDLVRPPTLSGPICVQLVFVTELLYKISYVGAAESYSSCPHSSSFAQPNIKPNTKSMIIIFILFYGNLIAKTPLP